jgi:hypothetical protein
MSFEINKTRDIKLNIRPIMISLYHEYVFEGPCRFVSGEKLKKEHDLKVNAEAFNNFGKKTKAALQVEGINVLEPILIQRDESFLVEEEDLMAMAKDIDDVDAVLFEGVGTDYVLEFAQRYKKPILAPGVSTINTAITSALLVRGLETYPCETWDDVIEIAKSLRVRKALAETKVLLLNRSNSNIAPMMIDSFISLEEVTAKFGTRFRYLSIHEFMDQTHNVLEGTNPTTPGKREANITDADEVEINKMTDTFIADAVECDMKREDIYPSMKAHYLVNKLLAKMGCNAFAAPCFDVCATRRLNEERFTFCLNHALNNENGISSACEYSITALLSMVVLSNAAMAPAYMGNTIPNPIKIGKMEQYSKGSSFNSISAQTAIKQLGNLDNLVLTYHSVPNRKFHGFNTQTAPYSIRSFAFSGWGATVRYDFARDKGQKITMCCFDPACKKLLVARGAIVGGIGYKDQNCSEGVFFQVADSKDFFNKISLVGNHIPLVYGDCFHMIVKLGKILGLEVITA